MVALVWRTRAAPVLHVNTFSKTVYDVLVGSNKSQGGVRRFLRWSGNDTRGMRGSRPQVIVFRMLSFAEAVGREVGPTGESMTRWRDRVLRNGQRIFWNRRDSRRTGHVAAGRLHALSHGTLARRVSQERTWRGSCPHRPGHSRIRSAHRLLARRGPPAGWGDGGFRRGDHHSRGGLSGAAK